MAYEREQEEAIKFLNMTKDEKIEHYGFATQEELAIHLGLPHTNIISKWKANPKFKKRKQEAFLEDFGDILPAAKRTLALRGIQDGDVNALKEIFKIAGVSIERVEQISNQDVQFVIQTVVEVVNDTLKDYPDLQMKVATSLQEKLGDI